MRNIQVAQDGMRIPKIEYDIYSKLSENKLQKLNKTICDNTQIFFFVSIDLQKIWIYIK